MNAAQAIKKIVHLRANPTPYQFRQVANVLLQHMREDEDFSDIVERVFASPPVERANNWLEFIELPYAAEFVHDDIGQHEWRISIGTVAGDVIASRVLSCTVTDLSGGDVRIVLARHRPEAIPLFEALSALIQVNWPKGELVGGDEDVYPQEEYVKTTQEDSTVSDMNKPWMKIPDLNWHRKALMLWWQGNTSDEIAKVIHVSKKTIDNTLAEYRKNPEYGPTIIPTAAELKRLGHR